MRAATAHVRVLVGFVPVDWCSATKGPKFSIERVKAATDLTSELLLSGQWKELSFKPYNFAAQGLLPQAGALHPLLKVHPLTKPTPLASTHAH